MVAFLLIGEAHHGFLGITSCPELRYIMIDTGMVSVVLIQYRIQLKLMLIKNHMLPRFLVLIIMQNLTCVLSGSSVKSESFEFKSSRSSP